MLWQNLQQQRKAIPTPRSMLAARNCLEKVDLFAKRMGDDEVALLENRNRTTPSTVTSSRRDGNQQTRQIGVYWYSSRCSPLWGNHVAPRTELFALDAIRPPRESFGSLRREKMGIVAGGIPDFLCTVKVLSKCSTLPGRSRHFREAAGAMAVPTSSSGMETPNRWTSFRGRGKVS